MQVHPLNFAMRKLKINRPTLVCSVLLRLVILGPLGQSPFCAAQEATPRIETQSAADIVTFTTQDDHREMQKQLGIAKLRPGPSGDSKNPNAANTDESKANLYPHLPELMTLKKGDKVTTADQWWKQRRPEIVEDFEREVLGRIPDNVPTVKWELLKTVEKRLGETDVIEKRLAGRVDNSGCPNIDVNIMMSVVMPKNAKGPVPTLMMFGFDCSVREASGVVTTTTQKRCRQLTQTCLKANWHGANMTAATPTCRTFLTL